MSKEQKEHTIKDLKEAFKKVSDILEPFAQDKEMIEVETSLIKSYQELLYLKGKIMKIQQEMQKHTIKLNMAQARFIQSKKR